MISGQQGTGAQERPSVPAEQRARGWCIVYTGPDGLGVVGPLTTKSNAEHKAARLLERGAATAIVTHYNSWAVVANAYGVPRSFNSKRAETYRTERLIYGGPVRIVDSTGTKRRLEALMTIGHSLPRLEDASDFGRWQLRNIHRRACKGHPVHRQTAERVKALYERLWNVHPVPKDRDEKVGINRTIAMAKRKGYAPPAAWDDDMIDDPNARPQLTADVVVTVDWVKVERALAGRPVDLSAAEKKAAALELARQGVLTRTQAAKQLRMSGEQVKAIWEQAA